MKQLFFPELGVVGKVTNLLELLLCISYIAGERNQVVSAGRTNNPFKKLKPDPNKSGNVLERNSDGKTVSKKALEGFKEWWNNKLQIRNMKGERIYSRAMLIDSKLYEESNLTTQNKRDLYDQFFALIKKAAYLGHKEAMHEYALQFEDISFLGVKNPLFNPKRRNFWYHKAIENGHPEAYNNLAHIYEIGEGVEKDYDKALQFYKKSAELGSVLGKKNYKIMLKDMSKGGTYNK